MSLPDLSDSALGIAAVERDTGLHKDTLRVWERRYGFPMPLREAGGERLYPMAQVHKLRQIKRLIDNGHRPGRLLALSDADFQQLLNGNPALPDTAGNDNGNDVVAALLDDRPHLRERLTHRLLTQGLRDFVIDTIAPLLQHIGEQWANGHLQVHEEHYCTEQIQRVLRQALHQTGPMLSPPRCLLTTVPGESHALGLLMAEAMLVGEGCLCLPLGVQTPIADIAAAARIHRADICVLSFSAVLASRDVLRAIDDLRRQLPAEILLWAGGRGVGCLRQMPPDDVHLADDLGTLPRWVEAWRSRHPAHGPA